MRQSVLISVLLHTVVVVIAYVGLPQLRRSPPLTETPIVVEIVNVAEETNVPAPAPEPTPEPEQKKSEPPRPPPPAAPKTVASPAPPPPLEPEPEPEVAAVPPPSPKPEPKPKAKPKPKAEAKPKPKAPPRLVKAKPRRKHKPPDAFTSVLRTVEELKRQPQRPKEKADEAKKKEEKKETYEAQIAKALASPTRRFDSELPLSISEIDLVRQQIAACWSLPAGAKEAEDLAIEVWVAMNPDGTVREARIRDKGRMESDPFFRSAAESALRAVLNPRCNPLRLPRQKYERWKTMTLTFNPREMFGS